MDTVRRFRAGSLTPGQTCKNAQTPKAKKSLARHARRRAAGVPAGNIRALRLFIKACNVLLWFAVLLCAPGLAALAAEPATRDGPEVLATCPAAAPAPIVTAGTRAGPGVALSFDADAFNEGTAEILDALKARSARATFFLTGTWIRNNRELVARMHADGHQIAPHGDTHADFRELDDAEIRSQLAAVESELARFGLRGRPYIRLPYDAYDRRVLEVLCAEGYIYISWVLDVRDAVGEPKSAQYVEARLLERLPAGERAGAIVLLHLGKPGTTAALPRVLDRFRADGFRMVTVRDLLAPARLIPSAPRRRYMLL